MSELQARKKRTPFTVYNVFQLIRSYARVKGEASFELDGGHDGLLKDILTVVNNQSSISTFQVLQVSFVWISNSMYLNSLSPLRSIVQLPMTMQAQVSIQLPAFLYHVAPNKLFFLKNFAETNASQLSKTQHTSQVAHSDRSVAPTFLGCPLFLLLCRIRILRPKKEKTHLMSKSFI